MSLSLSCHFSLYVSLFWPGNNARNKQHPRCSLTSVKQISTKRQSDIKQPTSQFSLIHTHTHSIHCVFSGQLSILQPITDELKQPNVGRDMHEHTQNKSLSAPVGGGGCH